MEKAKELWKAIGDEWKKSSKDLEKIDKLIDQFKVICLEHFFVLLPSTSVEEQNRADIVLMQRDVFEISALLAIARKDTKLFKRAVAELKHFYFDFSNVDTKVAESPLKYEMLGLSLMSLLADNQLADFHMELELLPPDVVAKTPYIFFPVQLEQYLMEGTYNKIFLSQKNLPSPNFDIFMKILLDTVRKEIATCIQKSYTDLRLDEAARLLFFEDTKTVNAFGVKSGWTVSADKKHFTFSEALKSKQVDGVIPIADLTKHNIFYAKQLEMIV